MSEMEMTNDVETEEFADELSDEALDREPEQERNVCTRTGGGHCRAGN